MTTILTDKRVRMLQGTGKPYRAFDLLVPGFRVQVSAKGHKAFCLAYRVNDKKRFQRLREYPYLPLGEARNRSARYKELLESGVEDLAKRLTPTPKPVERIHLPPQRQKVESGVPNL